MSWKRLRFPRARHKWRTVSWGISDSRWGLFWPRQTEKTADNKSKGNIKWANLALPCENGLRGLSGQLFNPGNNNLSRTGPWEAGSRAEFLWASSPLFTAHCDHEGAAYPLAMLSKAEMISVSGQLLTCLATGPASSDGVTSPRRLASPNDQPTVMDMAQATGKVRLIGGHTLGGPPETPVHCVARAYDVVTAGSGSASSSSSSSLVPVQMSSSSPTPGAISGSFCLLFSVFFPPPGRNQSQTAGNRPYLRLLTLLLCAPPIYSR